MKVIDGIDDESFAKMIAEVSSLTDLRKRLNLSRNPKTNLCLWQRILILNLNTDHFLKRNRKFYSLVDVENGFKRLRDNNNKYRKRDRAKINRRSYYMWSDYKKNDQKYKKEFDLTVEFIEITIKNGCFYCGEKSLKMTLDRIDNNIGHTVKNVNPACIRCNLFRRHMPYHLWMELVPKIREIQNDGLFDSWQGRDMYEIK